MEGAGVRVAPDADPRLIVAGPAYDRLVQRSFEKIRQSSLGMPAVMIGALEALARIMTGPASGRCPRRPTGPTSGGATRRS